MFGLLVFMGGRVGALGLDGDGSGRGDDVGDGVGDVTAVIAS